MKHCLEADDIVVAIHVVFQKIYVGRVDYWLWSGGPGTWDAWEKTPDGWKDFYVGARWINNLDDLRKVIEGHPGGRVWLVASTSLAAAAITSSRRSRIMWPSKTPTSCVFPRVGRHVGSLSLERCRI